MNIIFYGVVASLIAGLGTALGGVPCFFLKRTSDKFLDSALGFAAGIMLAATSFSLLVPAIESGGVWKASAGLLLGALFLVVTGRNIPHLHRIAALKGINSDMAKLWLFIFAVTIHNFPEGLAVGVGFGGGDIRGGTALAIGIGLQNIPEGLAVAFPLVRAGSSRIKAFWVALFTGLVEPVGGFIGAAFVSIGSFLLPYGLAFAGGAMLYVISEEIIPETHSRGNDRAATMGILIGFVVMMILDNVFG
ncbi:MAG: ZIP family metal transporter [Elusimicrobiota bacterium]